MDRRDVERLYVRYGPMVLRRAVALLRDGEAALDALQEVFIRALRTADGFRAEASPVTWLYRITTNHCLNVLRDEARRAELWAEHGPCGETTDGHAAEARVQMAQILRRVRPDLQEIAFYYLVDELKHEEIAALLGVSRRTIGYRLEEFRAAIARDLALAREAS
jgi:RNA polymerase sigma-70 factor (ECF subfamily)